MYIDVFLKHPYSCCARFPRVLVFAVFGQIWQNLAIRPGVLAEPCPSQKNMFDNNARDGMVSFALFGHPSKRLL